MAKVMPTVGWICTDRWLSVVSEVILDEKYEDLNTKFGEKSRTIVGRIGRLMVAVTSLPDEPDPTIPERVVQNVATGLRSIEAVLITTLGYEPLEALVRPGDIVIGCEGYHGDTRNSNSTGADVVQRAIRILQGEVGADGYWLSIDASSALSNLPDVLTLSQGSNKDLLKEPRILYEDLTTRTLVSEDEKTGNQMTAKVNEYGGTVVTGISATIFPEQKSSF
jgi:hypothetical protein